MLTELQEVQCDWITGRWISPATAETNGHLSKSLYNMQRKCTPIRTVASQTRGPEGSRGCRKKRHFLQDKFCLKLWGNIILILKQRPTHYRIECKIVKMRVKKETLY